MTRKKMLEALSDLPLALIFPGSWDDIEYTERELWVNNKGYGYFMCDEPTAHWEGDGLTAQEWENLKVKISDKSACYSDIMDTPIEVMLSATGYGQDYFQNDNGQEDNDCLLDLLSGLLELENGPCGYIYTLETYDGIEFYDSKSAFREAFERDWADKEWEGMDDDLLSTWIERLKGEDDEDIIEWAQRNGLEN